jgi:1,4-alpha-glucan branching enzyme
VPGVTDRGELALVLHTHMPYVEGFGTWPFGEEWLWEAMASCYLRLLDVLEGGAPLTLSLTPVLCDQLEAPGIGERFLTFLRDVREATHRIDVEGCRAGAPELVPELEASAADYRAAAERFETLDGDLLGALAPHARWTSAATHAVLPLLATDAGVRLQLEVGIDSHRRRFGDWDGGLWLPECAHAPWLDPLLEEAGVRATCLDLTDVLGGPGAAAHLRPLRSEAGPLLVPLDRATIELVWSDAGYPAHGAYRDYHHHTIHHHTPWANDGRPYDRAAARAMAREHAADFVARTRARLDAARDELGRPGLCVCALDTELLGHWWHEGPWWLQAVVEEAAAQGLALARLDDALERHEPAAAPAQLPVTTWGAPRDLATWSAPPVADFAWDGRAAELRVLAAGRDAGPRALRELLALQASDWAFMVTRGLAGDYPRTRARAHADALDEALRVGSADPALRSLAPTLHATGLPEG